MVAKLNAQSWILLLFFILRAPSGFAFFIVSDGDYLFRKLKSSDKICVAKAKRRLRPSDKGSDAKAIWDESEVIGFAPPESLPSDIEDLTQGFENDEEVFVYLPSAREHLLENVSQVVKGDVSICKTGKKKVSGRLARLSPDGSGYHPNNLPILLQYTNLKLESPTHCAHINQSGIFWMGGAVHDELPNFKNKKESFLSFCREHGVEVLLFENRGFVGRLTGSQMTTEIFGEIFDRWEDLAPTGWALEYRPEKISAVYPQAEQMQRKAPNVRAQRDERTSQSHYTFSEVYQKEYDLPGTIVFPVWTFDIFYNGQKINVADGRNTGTSRPYYDRVGLSSLGPRGPMFRRPEAAQAALDEAKREVSRLGSHNQRNTLGI